jgi:predicted alpha/beta-fold hydrolase
MDLLQLLNISVPSLTDPTQNYFWAHPLLPNGNFQTIFAGIYGDSIFKPKLNFKREYLDTADGGVIGLDWTEIPPEITPTTPTPYVFICHGLTGGSHEAYVQELVEELLKTGYRSVVMNFRGCSNTHVKTARLYGGSSIDDLDFCINHLIKRDPSAVVFGVGFSLGSNVLLKYAGNLGKRCPLVGIVSLANPYDVLGSVRALERSFIGKYIYAPQMGLNFKKLFMKNVHAFVNEEWFDLEQMNAVNQN